MSTTAIEKAAPQAVAKPKSVKGWLQQSAFQDELAKCLPKHITPERYARMCITALTRTPKLQQCTPESVIKCMLDLSATGLEPDGRRAHLIPYGKECTLIIDYKGLVELAMRSGEIANIHADVVCESDDFEENLGQVTKHIINRRKPRGDVFAAYCIVRYKDATIPPKCEVMSKDEIEAIRKRSKSGHSGPWVTDWSEMAKKTVFRRASKWLPLSAELRAQIEADDQYVDIAASRVTNAKAPDLFGGADESASVEVDEPPTTASEEQVKMIREQLKRDHLKESAFIDLCINEDLVSDTMTSLEDVKQIEPHVLDKIVSRWAELKARLLAEQARPA